MLLALRHHCNLGHHLQSAWGGVNLDLNALSSKITIRDFKINVLTLYFAPALRKHSITECLVSKVSHVGVQTSTTQELCVFWQITQPFKASVCSSVQGKYSMVPTIKICCGTKRIYTYMWYREHSNVLQLSPAIVTTNRTSESRGRNNRIQFYFNL